MFLPRLFCPAFTSSVNYHVRHFHQTSFCFRPSLTIRHFAPKTKRVHKPRSNIAPPGSPIPNRIAIVGGGLAGLAATYHLLYSTQRWARKRNFNASDLSLTIFDPSLPGTGGASAAAAGLLHPFTPRLKRKAWRAVKSLDAAMHLISIAEAEDPQTPLHVVSGLLRLALTDRGETDFRVAANRFPKEVHFLDADTVKQRFPYAAPMPGAFVPDAAIVNTKEYLRKLWKVCEHSQRVEWRTEPVNSVSQLLENGQFDTVVVTAGASTKGLTDLTHIPITPCRGQNLVMSHKEEESLTMDIVNENSSVQSNVPVISGKYIIPDYFEEYQPHRHQNLNQTSINNRSMIAGATFEYKDEDDTWNDFMQQVSKQDINRAINDLTDPLQQIFPKLFEEWRVSTTNSGSRALPPRSDQGSIPITCRVRGTSEETTCWLFTGLGSRGLLHHAYLGRVLAHAIVSGSEKHIPIDARRFELSLSQLDG